MKPPRLLLSHPTGNPNVRNAAIALAELGVLQEIITALAYNPQTPLARVFPAAWRRELARRTWLAPEGSQLRAYPWREVVRVALMRSGVVRKLGWNPQALVDWVYVGLDAAVARDRLAGLTGVYAYEDGAAATFTRAKERGLTCLYDLPIAFYRQSRQIQTEEREAFPELAAALQSTREPEWKLERKDREIQLADRIFVPSSIVKQSVLDAGIPPEKIRVIPYGCPHDYFFPQVKRDTTFRALFVGRIGPRKGLHYLLQAWQSLQLREAELMCVGLNEFPASWWQNWQHLVTAVPSVPHASLGEYYGQASVFVFPSLVEGLALVLLEAMACGIPIITTTHSGGADLIEEGVEGFIVPIRDAEAIAEKLAWCQAHPQELAEMGQAARRKAEIFTWERYRRHLAAEVRDALALN